MSEHVAEWALEWHRKGQQPPGVAQAALEMDPSVPARLEALSRDDEEILARYPPARVAREVRRRLTPDAPPRAIRPGLGRHLPALFAATLGAVLVLHWAPERSERTKGLAPHLEIYRRTGDGAQLLSPFARARAGDLLQLQIVGAGARYAVVISLDGAGGVTLHAPIPQAEALALTREGVERLPQAFALDDAPGFERFVLVTSDRPFPVQVVLEAARSLGPDRAGTLRLPEGLTQTSFVLTKEIVQ